MKTEKPLTLGSLFDGSGGFPLGGLLAGITPVWASEIEPFPIRVTTKRLPFMKHYGNISAMDGGRIEPVDIITFGSPCQDMSVAGRRDGLDGSRSSLFYEAVRIIKEMRCATGGRYPRYIVWENVPGAFSSNKGEDFKAVLEAVIGIAEPNAQVPMPKKARWPYADLYLGDGWSVAYRTLDAQYWGVPQRRRRIYLVADLAGRGAGKILFESEGLSGYSAEGFRSWQRAAGSFTPCAGAAGFDGYNGNLTDDTSATLGVNCGMSTGRNGIVLNDQGGNRMDITEEVTSTLRAEAHHPPCVMESAGFCTEHSAKSRTIGYEEECSPTLRAGVVPAAVALENHPTDSRVKLSEDGNVQTLTSRMGTGGNNVPLVMKIRSGCEGGGKGPLIQENKSATLSCNNDQTLFEPCGWDGGQVSPTLTKQNAGGNQRMPDKDNFTCVLQPFGISSKDSNAMKSDNPHSGIYEAETARTLDGNGDNPSCNQGGIAVVESYAIQGSMIGREDKNGPQGDGINEDVSFTLNTVDRHAVYAMTTGSYTQVEEETSPTIMARDYKDPNAVCYGIGRDTFNQGQNAKFAPTFEEELQPTLVAKGPGAIQSGYTVRRLTPTECARLQGFPDNWCTALGTEKPTDEEMYFWHKVFKTYAEVTGCKMKSDKQVAKWLKDPYSDSAEYKMWGNGVALPCVWFVLCGIVWYAQLCAENDPI
jgi:DNA (cytosine-5)-methyltransferase 1